MTWRTLTGLVAQAGLEIAEASAVIVDPLEGPGLDLPADLPRETLDWLCSQPGAYELDYVVAAVPAGEGQGAVPIAPTPAGPLPDRAATPRPRDGDPLARIERLTALALDHLERQELRSRDGAIGAEASAASARRDLERASVQFHRQVRELRTDYQKREARLRRDLAQRIAEERRATARRYERSTTWRIGRLATAPIRAIRRLVRRR
jgi:hypothetical protein